MPSQTYSVHAFAEKVALVTDGTSPIGRAVALQLALLGAYVVVGISPESSEETKSALEELKSLGTLAHAFEADLASAGGAKKLIGEVDQLFGRLDLLINTQKFEPENAFADIDEVLWQKTIDANLKSVFFVIQSASSLMKSRPKPVIINIVTNDEANDRNPAFVIAQAAIISLTEQLSRQLPENFRINCVAVNEKPDDKKAESAPTGLFKTSNSVAPDDVARVVIYLLSAEAKALNGQILTVDRR